MRREGLGQNPKEQTEEAKPAEEKEQTKKREDLQSSRVRVRRTKESASRVEGPVSAEVKSTVRSVLCT